jgi:hypothetical protein
VRFLLLDINFIEMMAKDSKKSSPEKVLERATFYTTRTLESI